MAQDAKVTAHNGQHLENSNVESETFALAGAQLGTLIQFKEGHLILNPTPSNDPNDPLNWSKAYKIYIACLCCFVVAMCNWITGGSAVALVQIGETFTHPLNFTKTSYFLSVQSLFQGVGLFVWMPFSTAYGRRPTYMLVFLGALACAIWGALAKTYASELVSRIFLGFFTAAPESLAAITISDIFFAHERGTYLAFYQVFLAVGVSVGLIFSGLTIHGTGNWRDIDWVAIAVWSFNFALIAIAFPETAYHRDHIDTHHLFAQAEYEAEREASELKDVAKPPVEAAPIPAKKTWIQNMALWSKVYTKESFWILFIRPFGLVLVPAVLWSILVFSGVLACLTGIVSNFSEALSSPPYNFNTIQSSLCFLGGIVGALIGIPFSGWLGDFLVTRSAKKNGGIREPEFRLPALYVNLISGPLAMVLYGVALQHKLHWMVLVTGVGLIFFTLVTATNHIIAYCIDCYKPIAPEILVSILGFKGIIAFVLACETNPWILSQGYLPAYGEMVSVLAFFLLCTLIFVQWGAEIRQRSFRWKAISWMRWDADRDDVQLVLH